MPSTTSSSTSTGGARSGTSKGAGNSTGKSTGNGTSKSTGTGTARSTGNGTGAPRKDTIFSLGLRVEDDDPLADPKQAREVSSSDPRHKAATACLQVAFSLLRAGHIQLYKLGQDVLKNSDSRYHLYDKPVSDLAGWAKQFPDRLAASFVEVRLSNSKTSDSWFEPFLGPPAGGSWSSRSARTGKVYLNKYAIESMAMALSGHSPQEEEAHEHFRFVLGLAAARSLANCFLRTLLRGEVPIEITNTAGLDPGHVWENTLLGGLVRAYESARNPLGPRQAGLLWLKPSSGPARRIRTSGLGDSVKTEFDLPLPLFRRDPSDQAFEAGRPRSMEDVRGEATVRARPVVRIPLRDTEFMPVQTPSARSAAGGGGGSEAQRRAEPSHKLVYTPDPAGGVVTVTPVPNPAAPLVSRSDGPYTWRRA